MFQRLVYLAAELFRFSVLFVAFLSRFEEMPGIDAVVLTEFPTQRASARADVC
ncbi:MAG TPA: hypothetical protein VNQ76_19140 [Planctomicrobium sp.]|nr:hypothetical protein [Planctomicrobium sp.]